MNTIRYFIFLIAFFVAGNSFAQSWSPRVKLSVQGINCSLNENMATCLAASGDTLHAVWSDHRLSGYAIYYTRSIDSGLTWSNPIAITDTTKGATFPAIAVSGNFVHVAWMDNQILGHNASFYKHSSDGGATWAATVVLDSNTTFWPGIAASGNLIVVSINNNPTPSNSEVYFRRSTNNGATWDKEQQISNAAGRSEDPAISALGNDVHLSWNDDRTGTMLIWYRHSSDGGVTWGPETQLTAIQSYTSMVSLNRTNTDVAYGINQNPNHTVVILHSSDSGRTFAAPKLLGTGLYPMLVRDGMNMHVVYPSLLSPSTVTYQHSTDAGVTWSGPIQLGNAFQTCIALTACTVHVLYNDSGVIYYMRNAGGNGDCKTSLQNPLLGMKSINSCSSFIDSLLPGTTFCCTDTLINTGDSVLIISSFTVTGAQRGEFFLPLLGQSIKPGDSLIASLCWRDTIPGLHNAVLTLYGRNGNDSVSVDIQLHEFIGTACMAASITDDSIEFSKYLMTGESDRECFSIYNCGNLSTLYELSTLDKYYKLSPSSAIINPGYSAQFCITYTQPSTGNENSTMNIHWGDSSKTVQLTIGPCVRIVVYPQNPTVAVGQSVKFTEAIVNEGDAIWTPKKLSFTGPCANSFKFISLAPPLAKHGDTIIFTLEFSPVSSGKCEAVLLLLNGGACMDSAFFPVWGTGIVNSVGSNDGSSGYILCENYPNPFNSKTTFSFTTPKESQIKITVTDIEGRAVRIILKGDVSAGDHLITFDSSDLPSGTYILSLESEGTRLTREIIVSK